MPDEKPPFDPATIVDTEKRGRGGNHFKKGYDPRRNTGGARERTKNGIAMTVKARGMCEDILDFWDDVRRNPDVPWRERIKASENIYNRAYGSATQVFDVSGTVSHQHQVASIDAKSLTQETRLQILNAVKQLPPPDHVEEADYHLIENNRETDDRDD